MLSHLTDFSSGGASYGSYRLAGETRSSAVDSRLDTTLLEPAKITTNIHHERAALPTPSMPAQAQPKRSDANGGYEANAPMRSCDSFVDPRMVPPNFASTMSKGLSPGFSDYSP